MKKDIEFPKVEGVQVVVARHQEPGSEPEWKVHLLNRNDFPIEGVLVASTGYGQLDGEKKRTSTLRQFFEKVAGGGHVLIEGIQPQLFSLTNEFWVSYYAAGKLFDKKFLFVPETIREDNLQHVEPLGTTGIVHT